MKALINDLLHPMSWLVIGFLILLILSRKWKAKRKVFGYWILGGFFYFFITPLFSYVLVGRLEDAFAPLHPVNLDTSKTYNIIVLGAGKGNDSRLPATSLLESAMLGRLVEGIRVHRKLPNSILITSGYSSIGEKTQAEVAKDAAIMLGVSPNFVFAQGQPTNTWEEAQQYVKDWGIETPLIIATSAYHQSRAVFLFKKAGVLNPIAAPTNYKYKKENPKSFFWYFKPNYIYMNDTRTALHELFGMVYAKITL